jgi:hypothetical protein
MPRSAGDLPDLAAALKRVPDVSSVEVDDGVVRFACSGDMDAVIKALAAWPLRSLDVAHADLEDAFFSAYDGPPTSGEGA